MDNQILNRLNELNQKISKPANIQNMLNNTVNLQSQIAASTAATQYALETSNRMDEIANSGNDASISKEEIDMLTEQSTDPTGLRPYIEWQIEQNDARTGQIEQLQTALQKQIAQNDTHTEQIEHLKAALQKQIEQNDTHTQQIGQLQAALQKQILDAEEERRLRETADKEEHQFTLKWNWRNLTVAIAGVLFGLAGFVVGLLALLATH